MEDQDFFSYNSIYIDEGFSKGPKSIYYGIGDEMLPGAILNVPQTDEDDEWGRTQRISDERSYDFIAKIYKTLFDPYNSIADVSLVPGEAGSEINVAKNMIKLVGRAGIDVGIFDLSASVMTLTDISLDGVAGSLSIGTGLTLTKEALILENDAELSSTISNSILRYKSKNTLRFTNNDSDPPYTEIIVNGEIYKFDENNFTLPLNGNINLNSGTIIGVSSLTLSGNISSNNILPISDNTYDIGSSIYRYQDIYGYDGYFSERVISPLYISPDSGGTLVHRALSHEFRSYDSTNFYLRVNDSGLEMDGDLIPNDSDMYDIGSSSKIWDNAYLNNIKTDVVSGYNSQDITFSVPTDNKMIFSINSLNIFEISTTGISTNYSIKPTYPNTGKTLGDSVFRWQGIYSDTIEVGSLNCSNPSTFNDTITASGISVSNLIVANSTSTGTATFTGTINCRAILPESGAPAIGSDASKFGSIYLTTRIVCPWIYSSGSMKIQALDGTNITLGWIDGSGATVDTAYTISNSSIQFHKSLVPVTSTSLDIGSSFKRIQNIYAEVGNFSGNVSCLGTLTTKNIYPENQTEEIKLGNWPDNYYYAVATKRLWLKDQVTLTNVEIASVNGVLYYNGAPV